MKNKRVDPFCLLLFQKLINLFAELEKELISPFYFFHELSLDQIE